MEHRLFKLLSKRILIRSLALVTAGTLMSALGLTSYAANVNTASANYSLLSSGSFSLDSMPHGTILYSNSFPGLYITYNGKTSYVVREGENKVTLAITVTDIKLAKESAQVIKMLFGINLSTLIEGYTFSKAASINVMPATETHQFEDIVDRYDMVVGKEPNPQDISMPFPNEPTFIEVPAPEDYPYDPDDDLGDDPDEPEEPADPNPKYSEERVIMLYAAASNLETVYSQVTSNILDI